jgi:transcriptional regulator
MGSTYFCLRSPRGPAKAAPRYDEAMYLPSYFRENRVPVLHGLIRERPLATLVTSGPDGMTANHIPMMIVAEPLPFGTLVGHVARGNSLWRAAGTSALAVFTGPEHYISPSWYPAKQEHGRVVPTWNYAAVHAYGTLEIHEDAEWLRALVTKLTETYEAPFEQPWKVADAPADYIDGLLKAIVGIEIKIDRLEGKWKMGQNRSDADREGAAEGLREMKTPSAAALGEMMASELMAKMQREN